ncbi:T6SS immunity protein Tli4 family protein [Massilia sp. DWR3-1-1]|uniref:T6SS immunity protein Tli4 family protein n=1 Tax=Massilia sp. DWR3-1-1 TaxID=2804559 RepID=UPI003CF98585
MKISISKKALFLIIFASGLTTYAFNYNAFGFRYSYKETAMPAPVKMSSRLERLFATTKLVCFGRYALEVPVEAKLDYGGVGDVDVFEDHPGGMKEIAAAALTKARSENKEMEVHFNGEGPIPNSWQIRYFPSESKKERGALMYETYIHKGTHIFSQRDIVLDGESGNSKVAERQRSFANRLRLRNEDEVPREPGYCIPHAFLAESTYDNQEMDSAGLFIPSLPDVSFSISSNKNAYADYNKDEYEKVWRAKLSLIGRINEAKKDQPFSYPSHTLLRQGKRDVHHWQGEESLIKRKDGSHDFEWALVGTPRDVANPSEFGVAMYTKVEHNKVGAARAASLSDDEAVALFDKLLTGLKFRVQVPGAPEGSYYFPTSGTPDTTRGK